MVETSRKKKKKIRVQNPIVLKIFLSPSRGVVQPKSLYVVIPQFLDNKSEFISMPQTAPCNCGQYA